MSIGSDSGEISRMRSNAFLQPMSAALTPVQDRATTPRELLLDNPSVHVPSEQQSIGQQSDVSTIKENLAWIKTSPPPISAHSERLGQQRLITQLGVRESQTLAQSPRSESQTPVQTPRSESQTPVQTPRSERQTSVVDNDDTISKTHDDETQTKDVQKKMKEISDGAPVQLREKLTYGDNVAHQFDKTAIRVLTAPMKATTAAVGLAATPLFGLTAVFAAGGAKIAKCLGNDKSANELNQAKVDALRYTASLTNIASVNIAAAVIAPLKDVANIVSVTTTNNEIGTEQMKALKEGYSSTIKTINNALPAKKNEVMNDTGEKTKKMSGLSGAVSTGIQKSAGALGGLMVKHSGASLGKHYKNAGGGEDSNGFKHSLLKLNHETAVARGSIFTRYIATSKK